MTGEAVEPEFPLVAAAQAAGVISPAHAQIVVRTVGKLPDAALEAAPKVEADLVNYAHTFDPAGLDTLAIRMLAHHDPDGQLHDVEYRRTHRDCRINPRPDGSGTVTSKPPPN